MNHLKELRKHGWKGTQLRFDLDLTTLFNRLYPNRSVTDLLCDPYDALYLCIKFCIVNNVSIPNNLILRRLNRIYKK